MNKDKPNITHMEFRDGFKQATDGLNSECRRLEQEIREMKDHHKIELDALEAQYANISDGAIMFAMIEMMAEAKLDKLPKEQANE